MRYMLDTNICIYVIKKHPETVLKKLTACDVSDICLSSITLAELMYGVQKSHHQRKNQAALDEFISPLEIIPFNETAATHYGQIRAALEKKGTPIGALDMMIAAHAHSLNVILVTNNTKEFARVPHLKLENWAH